MRCPACGQNTPGSWKTLRTENLAAHREILSSTPLSGMYGISIHYMTCANEECGQLVSRMHRTTYQGQGGIDRIETWGIWPRGGSTYRPVHPSVPLTFKQDFEEAAQLLEVSPRMSAALSRRILADLLREYAKIADFRLKDAIDRFIEDPRHPAALRQNLHYLREIGDFSAHTQRNDQAEIINVAREEAEWTLDVVERLFDYFIVTPARDAEMRRAMDEKLKAAGRKPIPRLAEQGSDADRTQGSQREPAADTASPEEGELRPDA